MQFFVKLQMCVEKLKDDPNVSIVTLSIWYH